MKSFLSLCSFVLLMGASSLAQQKRFIFRLDDIQDWFDNDIQANLLNFWMDNNIPVTAVVISNFFWGTDPETLAVVTKCAQMSPDMCQLGNHSPNHDDFFEYVNDTANAIYELQEVNNKIHTFFPGYEVEVFVPPFNYWNHNSLYAMQELQMPVISASSVAYSGMAYNLSSYPLQMPQQTQTGIYWANNNSWTPYPAEYIVLDCEEAAAKGEVCVIMVHTFEFAMQNGYTIAMLQDLVNQLYAAGFTGTNYHTVLNEVRQNTVPVGDSTMGRCGVNFGGLKCPYYDRCCSSDGWCGTGGYYCNAGCQVGYGYCNVSAEIHPTASPTAAPITKVTVPTVSPTTSPKSAAPSVGSKGTTAAPSVAKTTAPNIGSITVPTAKTIAPTIRSTASPTLGQTNFVEGSSSTSSSSSFEFNTQNIGIIAGGGFAFLLILVVGGYYYYQRRVMKKKNWTERVKSFRTENSDELIEEGHQALPKSDSALMGFVEDNLVLRHGMKLESERKPVSSSLSADNINTREESAV